METSHCGASTCGCKVTIKRVKNQIYRHFSKQENVFQAMIWPLIVVAPPVHSREGSGRCHCFSRPLPLLAAAAAKLFPVRCQRKRRGLFPAPVWPFPNLSPLFSAHPCCCGAAWLFFVRNNMAVDQFLFCQFRLKIENLL